MSLRKYIPKITTITSAAFFSAGLIFLVLAIWQFIKGDVPASTLGATAGLILLLASSIERFEVLKGFGIEARTRIDEKISEADEIISKLKKLTEITSSSLIEINSGVGFIGGPDFVQSYKLSNDVRDIMLSMGIDDEAIHRTLAPWRRLCLGSLTLSFDSKFRPELKKVLDTLESDLAKVKISKNADRQKTIEDSIAKIHSHENWFREISPNFEKKLSNYLEFIRNYPQLSSDLITAAHTEISSWEADIKHFLKTSKFLHKDKWLAMLENRVS